MKENSSGIKIRLLTYTILKEVFKGSYIQNAAAKVPLHTVSDKDKSLLNEIVYGVIRNKLYIDTYIPSKGDKRLIIIFEIALYQLLFLNKIPDYAVVNTTVNITKKLFGKKQSSYVNAILRSFLRKKSTHQKQINHIQEPALKLSITYSHPLWLINRWLKTWDYSTVEQLCKTNNTQAPRYIRVNTKQIDTVSFEQECTRENIPLSKTGSDIFYSCTANQPIDTIPGYHHGWFYIQDLSTRHAVTLLNIQDNQTILDLCASPGGKATLCAQQIKNKGIVIANDITLQKMQRLQENITRLQCNTTMHLVCSNKLPFKNNSFDRILIDVPCSNTGVIRRRPELRWRLTVQDIIRLVKKQKYLLEQSLSLLKSKGILVYSTCSIDEEENHNLVTSVLEQHKNYTLRQEITHLPTMNGSDGSYAAQIVKDKSTT